MLDRTLDCFWNVGFDFLMRIYSPHEPKVFEGSASTLDLCDYAKSEGSKKILVLTSEGMLELGIFEPMFNKLKEINVDYVVFDKVEPNPSISTVYKAINTYTEAGCDSIIAFGGGSVIDAAKAIAYQVGNKRDVEKLVGLFKGFKKPIPLYVVPTTAGTGSEVTSTAVLTDDKTHLKVFIVDHKLIAKATALDPDPMLGLPNFITADTGMDALTHAIEAYISKVSTDKLMKDSAKAVELIFKYLPKAYENGTDVEARENMAKASYLAGLAFNRMGLGFVHAISHQLTAAYGVPHGRANAIVLPRVLEASFDSIITKLSELASVIGVAKSDKSERENARKFLDSVIELSNKVNIPKNVVEFKEEDYAFIIKNARAEAIKNFPSPKLLTIEECDSILRDLKGSN